MAIKINGKNLAKRIINGQEVQKVMLNWAEIRPNEVPPTPVVDDFLCFTANESNCTIKLTYIIGIGTPNPVELEISYDKTNWSDYTMHSTITLSNVWDKVYWRNKSTTQVPFSSERVWFMFEIPKLCSASWDITYLLCKTWTNMIDDFDFRYLFQYSNIVTPPRIPATTLWDYCCMSMFTECSNLEAIPAIQATSLWEGCCNGMFEECTKIKLSETQTWEYQTPYRIPTTWTWTSQQDWSEHMFDYTWWTFTGTPNVNQTYYTSNTIIS